MLAPFASDAAATRGRRFLEPAADPGDEFQADRDRIIHSTAFRRLMYKTQVFLNHEGDLFRTRLTHSLEVAQLGRSMARALSLNEDLVEVIALAHDLGHTPFGHAGQDALQQCMREHGGFEHNLQSLRVVDHLETRYPQFDGLNLTFEAREGILKHCSRADAENLEATEPGGVAHRFLRGGHPSLEARLVNLADEMAYNAHDIDDGVRSGLITLEQAAQIPLVGEFRAQAIDQHPQLTTMPGRRLLFETMGRMLSAQVSDVIQASSIEVSRHQPANADAARQINGLIRFSDGMRGASAQLKRFLFSALYRHARVTRTTDVAKQVVRELFAAYLEAPVEMPDDYHARADRPRAVADYVAGMTDRFATREHQRLTGREAFAQALGG